MKALGAILALLMALASCSGTPGTATATPLVERSYAATAPTPAPYWDLLPLGSQLEGEWKTHRMDELNFAFLYPAVYTEVDCGGIFVAKKAVEKDEYTLIGFEGGTIRIRVFESWAGDLAEHVSEIVSESDVQLLTAVEQFSIDGVPALRHIYRVQGSSDPDYVKVAFAAFEDRLYMFQYNHMHSIICDAPPLSEEVVYEYILSTVEFNH